MDEAKHSLKRGSEYPYDAPDNWRESNAEEKPPAATDWAHAAARGILWDLRDRRGIKNGFYGVDQEIRAEIVSKISDIIREAETSR